MSGALICWDSSVVIDWVLDQKSKNPERIPAIRSVFDGVEDGRHQLAVSALVHAEVLESTTPADAMQKFRAFMNDTEMVDVIAVDVPIAEKAREIRDRASKRIKTPDALHLATAIAGGADVFHTFDRGLLSLSGADEVDGLVITDCAIPVNPRPRQ